MRQLAVGASVKQKGLWIFRFTVMKRIGKRIIMSSFISMIMKQENHWKGLFSACMSALMIRIRFRMKMVME